MSEVNSERRPVLVTGGGGFLGGAIVDRLLEADHPVRTFARGAYPDLKAKGVEHRRGDLGDIDAVRKAVRGCELVFHVGAKAGIWGAYEAFHRANVVGTHNVVEACRLEGVRRLVYTSSPSVVFDGRDQEGIDESAPYPRVFKAHYPKTKALAEQALLAAHGNGLATIALRPHLIWGPNDSHIVPGMVARARAGQLRRVGSADKKVDFTYIDNAAEAHLLAAEKLSSEPSVGGRAFFIGDDQPVELWSFVNQILEEAGVPPVTRSIPAALALTAGTVLENLYRLLRLKSEPRLTRFLAEELSTSHWYDISAAKRDLGYRPVVGVEEGLRRTGQWLRGEPDPPGGW